LPGDIAKLNVDASADGLGMLDAIRLARKVVGLDVNP
jgi:hypothetical protein